MKMGQALSLSYILVGLMVIGIIALFIFFFITRGQEIQVRVEENEILRRQFILANVLISSPYMVQSNGLNINRGILEVNKLNELTLNPEIIKSEISYPGKDYFVKVLDLENNNKWVIGEDFEMGFKIPVGIRYSDGEIHVGSLSVVFSK